MDLEEGTNYVVTVSTNFAGIFTGYEIDRQTGGKYAVFVQAGTTDRGKIPRRLIRTDNIISAEPVRIAK
jgi:hypothetical protein